MLETSFEYDGTNWTAGGDMVLKRRFGGMCGLQTAALCYGGQSIPATVAITEEYDGSAWATNVSMASAVFKHGSATAAPAGIALSFGGSPRITTTQEFIGKTTAETGSTIDFD